jgi:hypothetical protein
MKNLQVVVRSLMNRGDKSQHPFKRIKLNYLKSFVDPVFRKESETNNLLYDMGCYTAHTIKFAQPQLRCFSNNGLRVVKPASSRFHSIQILRY